jgi:RimJ/RimL family protein N-acetyltransferase
LIELSPSQGLLAATYEIALADPAYTAYSNLPGDVEAAEMAGERKKRVEDQKAAYWTLLPHSRQIAGIFELWFRDQRAGILEAGYWVVESHRGHRFAVESLRLVTKWVEQGTTATRIELAIHPENKPSLRVAEAARYEHQGMCTPSEAGAPRDHFYELYTWAR